MPIAREKRRNQKRPKPRPGIHADDARPRKRIVQNPLNERARDGHRRAGKRRGERTRQAHVEQYARVDV